MQLSDLKQNKQPTNNLPSIQKLGYVSPFVAVNLVGVKDNTLFIIVYGRLLYVGV